MTNQDLGFDYLPHPAVQEDDDPTFEHLSPCKRPQETRFMMKDGARLLFYPDDPPVLRGGKWVMYCGNECQRWLIDADAVASMSTKDSQ